MGTNRKKINKERRHRRIRAKVQGTKIRPRLSVFRSNQHVYAQLIDDERGVTLAAASDLELEKLKKEGKEKESKTKSDLAREVGQLIAEKARKQGIKEIVFDRGGFSYHGRVKLVAEGARQGGLKF